MQYVNKIKFPIAIKPGKHFAIYHYVKHIDYEKDSIFYVGTGRINSVNGY